MTDRGAYRDTLTPLGRDMFDALLEHKTWMNWRELARHTRRDVLTFYQLMLVRRMVKAGWVEKRRHTNARGVPVVEYQIKASRVDEA